MSDETPIPYLTTPLFPAHYDPDIHMYWVQDAYDNYIKISQSDLKLRLLKAGIHNDKLTNQPLSPVQEAILKIQNYSSISYAAPLAGYKKGIHEISGLKVLVTTSPKLIEPKAGDWPILARLLENLLGDQRLYFYGWMKVAVQCLRTGQHAPGQALVIAGEANSGKSLLQNLITEMLGGRSAKPYRYMSGDTQFNGDLFEAEHLMIEDEPASTDLRTRRKFAAQIKIFTVSKTQSCHPKGRNAINLPPLWRISITLNIEPENLLILPPLDESLEDKIILLKGAKQPMPMPTGTGLEKEVFWKTLVGELPAFVDFLLKWEIPDHLKSDRFGVTHYHHPEIKHALDTLAPEQRMLEKIDLIIFTEPKTNWEGTAAHLYAMLESVIPAYEFRLLLPYQVMAGTYLGRLAKSDPDRVKKHPSAAGNNWTIHPPEGMSP